jgi:hypothetical protein
MKLDRRIDVLEWILIILFSFFPVFLSFPYRVNIFLSWEGAFRISEGQLPFRDFGIPMGYMYWVIPGMFFKLLGPQLITLVKAQAFINIISGLAFRSILRSMPVIPGVRLVSLLVFLLTYSLPNFWPWYNHSVIVYELVALAFLCFFLLRNNHKAWLVLAGIFTFFSFFTKQDGGAMALILSVALLGYDLLFHKEWKNIVIYLGSFFLTGAIMVIPLLPHEFSYWFNYGQAPHSIRVSVGEILKDVFLNSFSLKLSFLMVLVALIMLWHHERAFFKNRAKMLFALLTLGIIAQAAILNVTSYTPPDNNIYYQAFVFAYLLSAMSVLLPHAWDKPWAYVLVIAGVFLWKSELYGGYIFRMFPAQLAETGSSVLAGGENVVNRSNYIFSQKTDDIPETEWRESGLDKFQQIRMPVPTIKGIERLKAMPLMNKNGLRVLNMSELTPLAAEIPFKLERGKGHPLWYHLGVGSFNREAATFEWQIANKTYDLVLFEHVPALNNFYPFRVRDSLQMHYRKVDSFYAPRRGALTMGMIEVYVR